MAIVSPASAINTVRGRSSVRCPCAHQARSTLRSPAATSRTTGRDSAATTSSASSAISGSINESVFGRNAVHDAISHVP